MIGIGINLWRAALGGGGSGIGDSDLTTIGGDTITTIGGDPITVN
jgi:hypothetical protein